MARSVMGRTNMVASIPAMQRTVSAIAAPAIAAIVIGRSIPFVILVVIAAALMLSLAGSSFTVRGGSLGGAIVITAVHGPVAANVAIAVAAIASAGLAVTSSERVLASFPRKAVDALLCGFAVAGVARVVPLLFWPPSAPPASGLTSALVGDTVALAVLFSFEAARVVRPPRASAFSHLTAASAALPVGYARRAPATLAPIAMAASLIVIVAVLVPQLRSTLALLGVALTALVEVVRRGRRLGARAAAFGVVLAALAAGTRPAVAVLFALVIVVPVLGTWSSPVKAPERG